MEALLNICWLILAAAAVVLWSLRQRPSESRFTVETEALALLCILILLFFPISLTDDLHPEITLATDFSSNRRAAPSHLAAIPHFAFTAVGFVSIMAAFTVRPKFAAYLVCNVLDLQVLLPEGRLARPVKGRAPPAVL